jgi:hypothetical protein
VIFHGGGEASTTMAYVNIRAIDWAKKALN